MEHGCGQCLPCRINRRRLWTARLTLEAFLHDHSAFVTLTYAPAHLPADGSVSPRHLKLFLMRLRKAAGKSFRYFAVGEYGTRGGRPHYHALLFSSPSVELINRCWVLGQIHVGTVTAASASYVTGYCTKAWTREGDPRLKGRHPEFCRMSLKPGIGAGAIPEIARAARAGGSRYIASKGDVPRELRIAGKKMDIGRYLTGKLREALGRDKGCPEILLGVKALEFWTKFKDADAWAAHMAKRQADRWRSARLDEIQRSKGLL